MLNITSRLDADARVIRERDTARTVTRTLIGENEGDDALTSTFVYSSAPSGNRYSCRTAQSSPLLMMPLGGKRPVQAVHSSSSWNMT
ncbi:hypothetical protein [Pectobacterium aquaticum]|uniref:hypothetical protein n=1 Tax=Pectobacterium aquaticum TaxID=2204145 RepID=UPI001E447A27|nr:hypothetical protein [Pectobacterium aquaticum]UEM39605.1 hypothetical protein DMB82_0000650 [Pectobacterium aquaticum]